MARCSRFSAVVGSVVALLVFSPYTWSGGGGPPGNRYFMSLYPALFFLTPPLTSMAPAVLAWLGRRAVHGEDARQPVRTPRSIRS